VLWRDVRMGRFLRMSWNQIRLAQTAGMLDELHAALAPGVSRVSVGVPLRIPWLSLGSLIVSASD